jgi:hypothetical protein
METITPNKMVSKVLEDLLIKYSAETPNMSRKATMHNSILIDLFSIRKLFLS